MIVYEYENNEVIAKTLTDEEKQTVVGSVTSKWSRWSKPIADLRANRDTVLKRTKPQVCKDDAKDWHSKICLNRPYEYYNKLYGILYETFYDKISSYLKMGKNNYDAVYNAAFNVENKRYLLLCMKDLLESGEIVASAELKNTYKKRVLPITEIGNVDPSTIVSVKENSFVVKEKADEKINFIRINPCNFAYDPAQVPGTEDFDNCDKIVKMWKTKQEIYSNKNYEITKDELDLVVGDNNTNNDNANDRMDYDNVIRGNQVEVLTYYGSFTIDGKYYDNYVAVIIARKYLAYFAPKGIYTPGIYYYPYHQQGNGTRGVSPLYYILDLCKSEEKTFNDAIDFIQLQKNPPKYVPNGFFEEPIIKLEPGLNITYNMGMQDPSAIIPMSFNAEPLVLFQEATKQLSKEIGGIDNGTLSEKNGALTAYEVKRIVESDSLIPNMIISGILLNIVSKYLKDCVQMVNQSEFDESIVKTAWEFSNEQVQMQNVVNVLKDIGANDPSMVNLESSSRKTLEIMGVNPDEYLTTSRGQEIINNLGGLSDNVLQQVFQIAQQLQVDENNKKKAQVLMAQLQDSEYRKQMKETWESTGALPETFLVPNGATNMEVPVEAVTPESQTKNRPSTTAN